MISRYLQTTLKILLADVDSLRSLAALSEFDVFTFYEGADLKEVDLGGQDLRGLSFSDADLRGANLGGISYDLGAFNNSVLSEQHKTLQDEFDVYLEDAVMEPLKRVYIFSRFRPESFEYCRAILGLSYSHLAELSKVSSATVRKASRGLVVSLETASNIANSFEGVAAGINEDDSDKLSALRQPMLECLADEIEGGFKHIRREELLNIANLAQRVTELRGSRGSVNIGENYMWRERPRILEWYENFYSKGAPEDRSNMLFD